MPANAGLLKGLKKMTIIKTKYLSPTNTRGARIKAMANGFNVSIPYPYQLSHELVHFEAVKALITKHNLDWNISNMGYGSDNDGYYFTFASSTIGG
jgi:hypothetical protein